MGFIDRIGLNKNLGGRFVVKSYFLRDQELRDYRFF